MNEHVTKKERKETVLGYKNEYKESRRRAKRIYKARAHLAKRRYANAVLEYDATHGTSPKDPPKRSILEEIGNSVTHGVGSVFAIVAFTLMIAAADTVGEYAAAFIYFIGQLIMFTMSCLYHALPHGSAVKRLFRRFDYSSIYLLIGATFAPPLINVVGGTFGTVFFIVQWAVIAAGIIPSIERLISTVACILLSATGSSILPRSVIHPQRLARYPSITSLAPAVMNVITARVISRRTK